MVPVTATVSIPANMITDWNTSVQITAFRPPCINANLNQHFFVFIFLNTHSRLPLEKTLWSLCTRCGYNNVVQKAPCWIANEAEGQKKQRGYIIQTANRAIFVWPWNKRSLLIYQPIDEKIKTWTLRFPAKENPNMEKTLFDWPIVLQYDVKAKYRLISRKFSGMKFFHPSVRLTNQKPRAFVSVR